MNNKEALQDLLDQANFRCNTSRLHQYFIANDEILNLIVESAEIKPRETVLEIGTGIGNITALLAQKARKVISYEIDQRLQVFLEPLASDNSNIQLQYADATKIKWPKFDCLVANIPFYIIEQVASKLSKKKFRIAILVAGDSFIESISSSIENFAKISRVGVLMHSCFKIQTVGMISREDFLPQPKTDAVIVKLSPKSWKEISKNNFLRVCCQLFSQPTLKVKHILHQVNYPKKIDARDWENYEKEATLLNGMPLCILEKRADKLTNNDFRRIYDHFSKMKTGY